MGEAVVSVHDVMPETLGRVRRILDVLEEAGVPPATLLVVPGRAWTDEGLRVLRGLSEKGHALAGHGWVHECGPGRRTVFHRLHGLVISRNVAEHLSRPPNELMDLMRECYNWFPSVDLPAPKLYVPPAWALGSVRPGHLKALPFRWYEVLRGWIDGGTGRVRWLPLAGFEADTGLRRVVLKLWNGMNRRVAERIRRPLRISVHPDDLDLLLGRDLREVVRNPWRFLPDGKIMESSLPGKGG